MKATYKNSFCCDKDCINYFECMCMAAINEKGTEIYPLANLVGKGRESKECQEFRAGTFLMYEVEMGCEDFIEDEVIKIATRYKYVAKKQVVKPGDVFLKSDTETYKEIEGIEIPIGDLGKLYIAVDTMLYDLSNQWEEGLNPYDFLGEVTNIMRGISMLKEPNYFQDCKNCEFVCKIDGVCTYDMFPGYEEGQPLYCQLKEADKK